jgi:predicted RNase H-like HicB family nuclease
VRLTYSIVLDPAEEGGYVVRVPRLPGCVTEGDSLDEAVDNAREAITAYLLALLDDGKELPAPDEGGIAVRAVAVDVGPA